MIASATRHLTKLSRSEVNYDGEQLSYGLLVMNESDFSYFKEIIKDNRIQLEACVSDSGENSAIVSISSIYDILVAVCRQTDRHYIQIYRYRYR